jgi:RimJ/RimL family protein N-acetyltransferase
MAPVVGLRHADEEDLDFLFELAADEAVEPFLAPRPRDHEQRLRELLHQAPFGMLLIDADGKRAGALALALTSEHSRLCQLSRLMVTPECRGQGVGVTAVRLACRLAIAEHGMHRVQAEVYGYNAASQRLFELAGFTREGVRRRAYRRHDEWVDGVLYGLLAGELSE